MQKAAFPFPFPLLSAVGFGCSSGRMNSCESSGGKGQARIASPNGAVFPWIKLFIPHALPNP